MLIVNHEFSGCEAGQSVNRQQLIIHFSLVVKNAFDMWSLWHKNTSPIISLLKSE